MEDKGKQEKQRQREQALGVDKSSKPLDMFWGLGYSSEEMLSGGAETGVADLETTYDSRFTHDLTLLPAGRMTHPAIPILETPRAQQQNWFPRCQAGSQGLHPHPREEGEF